ncbi:MAG: N-formylglutamate amidohydrolase [Polyangiaceae bacterium]
MPLLPFRVLEPPGEESPLLVEVPHAGLVVDDGTRASCVAPPRSIEKDADRYVDELYADAPRLGATLLVATYSRYVVDLNRAETDVDGGSVQGIVGPMRASRGVVWRLTGDGLPVLAAPLEPAELERRLATVYRPYHEALYRIVRRKVAKHGFAVVLAAHSMPSMGTLPSGRKGPPRADVVPGTRGRTSAANVLIDAVDHHARTEGYSVSHDDPYRGGFTTAHYGRPRDGVHVVQIELARRLYMDETTLERHDGFARTRALAAGLMNALTHAARSLVTT